MQSFLIPNATAEPKSYKVAPSRRMVYGGIATVVLLVSIAIVACCFFRINNNHHPGHGSCVPFRKIQPIRQNKLVTDDAAALAHLAGYVELLDENIESNLDSSYLPLEFNTIVHDQLYNGPRVVSLIGDCVTLDIKYSKKKQHNSGEVYAYEGIDLNIRDGRKLERRPEKRCDFKPGFFLEQAISERYSCLQTRAIRCYHRDQNAIESVAKQVANLVLSTFELELDGDPVTLQLGVFSKAPMEDGCSKWSRMIHF